MRLIFLAVIAVFTCAACDYSVETASGESVRIPRADWRPMWSNPEPFADNFEARRVKAGEVETQQLTIFKIPMTPDRRIGMEVKPREYIEFFVVKPPAITMQMRLERQGYWILSRQTFKPLADSSEQSAQYQRFLSDADNRALLVAFQTQVDRTRFQLYSMFTE